MTLFFKTIFPSYSILDVDIRLTQCPFIFFIRSLALFTKVSIHILTQHYQTLCSKGDNMAILMLCVLSTTYILLSLYTNTYANYSSGWFL